MRSVFLITKNPVPSGGTRVLHTLVDELRAMGRDVQVIDVDAAGWLMDASGKGIDSRHPQRLAAVTALTYGRRGRLRHAITRWLRSAGPPEWGDDVCLFVPEFQYKFAALAYPKTRKVLITQGHGVLLDCFSDRALPDVPMSAYSGHVVVSEICADTVLALGGAHPLRLCLPIGKDFSFAAIKSRTLAFMPRRASEEAAQVLDILRQRGRVAMPRVVALDRMPLAEVAAVMRDSLIFMVLSRREGFGLPAAEAMRCGCIVIGYDGQGGAEFMTPDIARPVREGRTLDVVEAIEGVLAEFDRDPVALDPVRQAASRRIALRYSEEAWRSSIKEAWDRLEM